MKNRFHRSKKGYALVSVMVLGAFAVIFLLGLAAMLVSLMDSEAVSKHKSGLLDAAEVGMDYAVNSINRSMQTGDLSGFEFVSETESQTVSLPSDYIDDNHTQVFMKLRKLTREEALEHLDWGLLASPQLEPIAVNPGYLSPVRGGVGNPLNETRIRVLEVTATANKFSQSIRTVLTPRLDPPVGNAGLPGTDAKSIFPDVGIFAVTRLNLRPRTDGGSLTVQSLVNHQSPAEGIDSSTGRPSVTQRNGSSYNLTVQSNQQATIGKNTQLIGNLKVSNNTISAPNDIASVVDNGTIYGRVESNSGNNSSLIGTNGPAEQTGDNVLANAERLLDSEQGNLRSSPNDTPIDSSAGETPNGTTPVPSTATQSVDTTGDGIANTTNDLGQFVSEVSNGSKAVLDHGVDPSNSNSDVFQFKSTGLDTSATGNLPIIEVPSTNTNPTQIFVEGANSDTAVNIDSSRFKNLSTDPRNMQLFYDGTNDVNVSVNGNDFSGTIFAPNARVSVTGTGNFNGAIVGNRVNVRLNGNMRLDTGLSDNPSSGNPSQSTIAVPTVQYNGQSLAFYGYEASTFQEVQGKLVTAPGG